MPWGDHNQGNGQGPWGKPGGKKPAGPQQPDIDALLNKMKSEFGGRFGGGGEPGGFNPKLFGLIAAIVLVLWMATGFYKVNPEEQGVVLRFGEYNRITSPGLNYHLPSPVERVIKVPVTTINRIEIGTRSTTGRGRPIKVNAESLMLTGDENIVDIDFEVQWRIKDAAHFLFNLRGQTDTVKSAAESAMREVVGRNEIADVLTEGRLAVEQETKKIIQEILDLYEAGIEIVRVQMREVQPPAQVIDAFRDVQTARADRERLRNEAETYRNDIIPKARGDAERIIQEAEAYKQEVVARSSGEAERFSAVYNEYRKAKDVTKKRIYLETMDDVMGNMEKVLIDNDGNGSGVVPYLALPELNKRQGTN